MNESVATGAEVAVQDQAVHSALQSYLDAQNKHEQALATTGESEQRMQELQAQAEESHLTVIEAEAEATQAKEELRTFHEQEAAARSQLDEAYAILEEAKKLVGEHKEKVKQAEAARVDVENRFSPVFLRLIKAKSVHEKILALSSVEAARLRKRIASAEERMLEQKAAVCDAKISLVDSVDGSLAWSEIKGLIGEGA